jgi:acetyl esterase/lipase
MSKKAYGVRLGLGRALLVLLVVHFALAMLPMPTFGLWMGRLVARETWLFATALGVVALFMGPTSWIRGLGLTAALFGLRALIGAWPMFALVSGSFSPGEYLSFSTGAGGGVSVQRDLALVPSRPDLTLDLYQGAGAGPRPLVVVIHGGSWQRGDKGEVAQVSRAIAAAGWSVADIRYRLVPAHPFPAPVADVKCQLGKLREQAAKLGLDPGRVVLLGRSAGGHLALLAAYSMGDKRLPPSCAVPEPLSEQPVRGVIALYPIVDLEGAYAQPPSPDILDTRDALHKLIGGPPAQLAEPYRLATPTWWVAQKGARIPPTLLLHGQDDLLVPLWHSKKMFDALTEGQHTAKLLGIPNADHGFDFRKGGIGEQLERAAVLDFLRGR